MIHVGDCILGLRSLADKSIDVVITDPPYSDHVHVNGRAGTALTVPGWDGKIIDKPRDLGFAALTDDVRRAAAREIARLVRRWVAVFSDTESAHLWKEELEAAHLEYVRTCFWRKKGGAPQFTGDRPAVACEAITLCHPRGMKRWNGGGKQGWYDVPIVIEHSADQAEKRVHTTQKPEALMLQLVEDFSEPGELVLDPFAGSGTTGAAALQLGRRFLGWELDASVAQIAQARLAGLAYKPAPVPAAPPAQVDLFGGGG